MQEKGERKGKKGMRLLKEERRMAPDSPRRPESFALNEVYINWEVPHKRDTAADAAQGCPRGRGSALPAERLRCGRKNRAGHNAKERQAPARPAARSPAGGAWTAVRFVPMVSGLKTKNASPAFCKRKRPKAFRMLWGILLRQCGAGGSRRPERIRESGPDSSARWCGSADTSSRCRGRQDPAPWPS